jgi:hypothetical protein
LNTVELDGHRIRNVEPPGSVYASPSSRRCQLGPSTVGQAQVATWSISTYNHPTPLWADACFPPPVAPQLTVSKMLTNGISLTNKLYVLSIACEVVCLNQWFLVLFTPNAYSPLATNQSTPGFLQFSPCFSRSSCQCLVSPMSLPLGWSFTTPRLRHDTIIWQWVRVRAHALDSRSYHA